MKKYHELYFESISHGLLNTEYKKDGNLLDAETFYSLVNQELTNLRENNGRLFFCGNGASAAFANHMALDFSKNGGIKSYSLSDSALLTALSNDYSYEESFVEFLKIEKATKKDVLVTVSSSGNSINVVNSINYCNDKSISTIALSGLKSNNLSTKKAKYSVYVPMKTYGIVECIHQIILHLMLDKSMNITEWDRNSFQNMNATDFNL